MKTARSTLRALTTPGLMLGGFVLGGFVLGGFGAALPARAMDLSGGLMAAVPVPGGKAPAIDGDLSDWDLSRAEPVWVAEQTIRQLNAEWALMYDRDALYIGARASLPGRPLRNSASPVEQFWQGDLLQMRLGADPGLPYPLDAERDKGSERVAHLSLWKNTETGQDFLHVNRGTQFDRGHEANPAGSSIKITTHGSSHYVVEARLPWAALRAPGGLNPFRPGQKAAVVLEALWVGGDQSRTSAVYRENPGTFAFSRPAAWGQLEFLARGGGARARPTWEQLFAQAEANTRPGASTGVPITVLVPRPSKVSVNIFDADGSVLREIIGGEAHAAGPLTVRWDGKDQWGTPMAPGPYRWGAYFSNGVSPQFMGGFGKTSETYHETADGRGGWGADHSDPIDVAADAGGMYFLWPVAEAGRNIVKTDYAGKILWRKTPFVGGGFGPLYAVASNGRHVFLSFGESKPQLLRLNPVTGQLLTWGVEPGASSLAPISESEAVEAPPHSSPLASGATFGQHASAKQPETVALAASDSEVYAPVYSQNKIQVLDAATGKPLRELSCPGPRGVALSAGGDLYAVSYVAGKTPQVLAFAQGRGEARVVISGGLAAPWDLSLDARGRLFVSDGGESQQVKVFELTLRGAKLARSLGRAGGRPWAGAYKADAFRNPAGVAVDARGGLLVAESAIPKVMSRWDARTLRPLRHWFGAPTYWTATWPEPDDPWTAYYQLNGGFARATIPGPGRNGDRPSAYWNLPAAGLPGAGNFEEAIHTVLIGSNKKKYLAGAVSPNGIALVQGDRVLPVARFRVWNQGHKENTRQKNYAEVWQDRNGDHREQPAEVSILDTVEGKPLVPLADWFVHSSLFTPSGDFYIQTAANKILLIPSEGFDRNGAPRWNLGRARYVAAPIFPAFGDSMYVGPRGQSGIRVDSKSNIYTVLSAKAPAVTPELRARMEKEFPGLPQSKWGAYATPELAERMMEGMGHTGESNIVKFVKFDRNGRMLWTAGRKATAGARPGEMYHVWALAGLIGDEYIAVASEWGPFTLYTHDGFYVDSFMNDPGQNPPPGPYTFGGETGAGRVQYFPGRDEVWAYSVGMAYRLQNFKNGKVQGEGRLQGTVSLDRVYESETTIAQNAPLQIIPLNGDPMKEPSAWQNAPTSTLRRENRPLATAQLGYDALNLYGRIHVADATPLENSADGLNLAFKGGDTAGIVLGCAPAHAEPQAGDVRIMAARVNGQPRLVAMKAVTAREKRPEEYFTPSAGRVRFEWVGEVPGGQVLLVPDVGNAGYTATFSVPRAFLEFDLAPGTALVGDVEVRLSGQGQRGLQATSRNYLFTPQTGPTSMTDDVPTEARLYPQGWGPVEIR
jgi:hypothetical protein